MLTNETAPNFFWVMANVAWAHFFLFEPCWPGSLTMAIKFRSKHVSSRVARTQFGAPNYGRVSLASTSTSTSASTRTSTSTSTRTSQYARPFCWLATNIRAKFKRNTGSSRAPQPQEGQKVHFRRARNKSSETKWPSC